MPGRPKDIEHHQVDLRSKKARDVFRAGDVDALIHLGVMHDPRARPAEHHSWNVTGTTKLLEYCQAYRVPKVVLLSSRERLRPAPRQPAVPHRGRAAARRAAVSRRCATSSRSTPGLDVLLERAGDRDRDPAAGAHRRAGAQRAVELPAARAAADAARLRSDGAARSTYAGRRRGDRAARSRPGGAASTTSSAPARCPLSAILASSAASRDADPAPARQAAPVARVPRSGMSSFPVAELDFIRYVCMVDGRARRGRARRSGPSYGLRETIRAVDDPAVLELRAHASCRIAERHTGV